MLLEDKDPSFGDSGKGTDIQHPSFVTQGRARLQDADSIPQRLRDLSDPAVMSILTGLASYLAGLKKAGRGVDENETAALQAIRDRITALIERIGSAEAKNFDLDEYRQKIDAVLVEVNAGKRKLIPFMATFLDEKMKQATLSDNDVRMLVQMRKILTEVIEKDANTFRELRGEAYFKKLDADPEVVELRKVAAQNGITDVNEPLTRVNFWDSPKNQRIKAEAQSEAEQIFPRVAKRPGIKVEFDTNGELISLDLYEYQKRIDKILAKPKAIAPQASARPAPAAAPVPSPRPMPTPTQPPRQIPPAPIQPKKQREETGTHVGRALNWVKSLGGKDKK